ncbi:MAG TPA: DUF2752 domain-containing protein [Verrucomicrobiae bacterium]
MISGEFQRDDFRKRAFIGAGILVAAAVVALGAKLCLDFGLAWRCPMLLVLGIPCPSCGTTRAFAALAEMKFVSAVMFNPLFVVGLMAAPIFLFVRQVPEGLKRKGWFVLAVVAAVNWVYLILYLPR